MLLILEIILTIAAWKRGWKDGLFYLWQSPSSPALYYDWQSG